MSYNPFWPSWRKSTFRGTGELLWKALRISYKIDRIAVPLLIPPAVFLTWISGNNWVTDKDKKNPYVEEVLRKKAEGKYDGEVIGIRPHHYT
ncbi:unnamed protein product [Blepharisma stoltei]|uniref:Uncharacterized protein n=1 Tax=Blepharisma stoltei TaxID=1481888 RepID=A0AAU9JHC8_9CILI|nr:unnamed protein product [Blepharisma stoltei]